MLEKFLVLAYLLPMVLTSGCRRPLVSSARELPITCVAYIEAISAIDAMTIKNPANAPRYVHTSPPSPPSMSPKVFALSQSESDRNVIFAGD
jgi:hypothetical protein